MVSFFFPLLLSTLQPTASPEASTLAPPEPAAAPAPSPVPQVARVQVSPNSTKSLAFEWDGMNVDGVAHGVPVYRVVVKYTDPATPTATHEVVIDMVEEVDASGGTTKIPMKDALRGIPAGDWDCQAALEDVSGQRGPFSVVTDRTRWTVNLVPPSAPKNVGAVDD